MAKSKYRIITFEADAKVELSGSMILTDRKGNVLHRVDLATLYPMKCPLFRSIEFRKGDVVNIAFSLDLDMEDLPVRKDGD